MQIMYKKQVNGNIYIGKGEKTENTLKYLKKHLQYKMGCDRIFSVARRWPIAKW